MLQRQRLDGVHLQRIIKLLIKRFGSLDALLNNASLLVNAILAAFEAGTMRPCRGTGSLVGFELLLVLGIDIRLRKLLELCIRINVMLRRSRFDLIYLEHCHIRVD